MQNKILSITRNIIPYVKELRQLELIRSVASAILMQQLDYWFDKYPDGFYKFLQPCPSHKAYKKGDSWVEELAFSPDEFRTAFDSIGVRHASKTISRNTDNPFCKDFDGSPQEFYYYSYHDKKQGLTWYFRNHNFVDSALNTLSVASGESPEAPKTKPFPIDWRCQSTVNWQRQSIEMDNAHLHKLATPIYRNGQRPFTDPIYTEITPETTPEITSSPLPPSGGNPEEKKNSTPEKLPLPADPPNPNPPAALLNQPEPLDQPIEPHEDSDSEAANENDSSFQRIINERNNLSAIFSLDGHYAHDVGLAGSSSPPRLDADIQDGGIGSGRNAVGNDGIEQPRSSASAQALSQVDKNDENLSQSNKSGKPSNRVDSFGNNRDLHARTEPGRDRGDADTAGHSNGATVGGANSAHQFSPQERGEPSNNPILLQRQQISSKRLPPLLQETSDARVVVDSSKHTHPTQKSDDRFKNHLHPWQKSRKRNDFDEGFVTYLRDKHLPTTDFYKSKGVTEGDAKNWINQRQWDEAGLAQVYAKWEDYQAQLANDEARSQSSTSAKFKLSHQQDIPDFPIIPRRQHQQWVEEYLAEGKETFAAKYHWVSDWLAHLNYCMRDLLKKLEQANGCTGS